MDNKFHKPAYVWVVFVAGQVPAVHLKLADARNVMIDAHVSGIDSALHKYLKAGAKR